MTQSFGSQLLFSVLFKVFYISVDTLAGKGFQIQEMGNIQCKIIMICFLSE